MLRSKAKADARQGYFGDDGPVAGIRILKVMSIIGATTTLTACHRNDETDLSKYETIIEDSFARQAAAERSSIEDVKAYQVAVTLEGHEETCIILVRGEFAGSQRCYVKKANGWVVVSEKIAPVI
jgi:hypothetical protein